MSDSLEPNSDDYVIKLLKEAFSEDAGYSIELSKNKRQNWIEEAKKLLAKKKKVDPEWIKVINEDNFRLSSLITEKCKKEHIEKDELLIKTGINLNRILEVENSEDRYFSDNDKSLISHLMDFLDIPIAVIRIYIRKQIDKANSLFADRSVDSFLDPQFGLVGGIEKHDIDTIPESSIAYPSSQFWAELRETVDKNGRHDLLD